MAYRGYVSHKPVPSSGRAEPAPPRGGPSKLGWPRGGRPGDDAGGGFFGGAHSVRPHCEALLVPRLFITRDGWLSGRGLMETCFGQAQAFFNGRAEPAPPWGGRPEKTAYREGAGDGAKSEFCGGMRSARPEGSVPAHAGAWLLGHRVPCPGNWCQHFSRPGGGA